MSRKRNDKKSAVRAEHSDQLFAKSELKDQRSPRYDRPVTANRQEVLNVIVAQLLQDRGLVALPEQIITRLELRSRRMPDVLVDFQGLRLVIESEYEARSAKDKASHAALRRVSEGIAHLGMALIYPEILRTAAGDNDTLRNLLMTETLQYAIVTESEAAVQFTLPFAAPDKPVIPSVKGTLDQVADALRRAYDELVRDDVLNRAVRLLERGIESFTFALAPQPAATGRFMAALGIKELPRAKKEKTK